MKKIISMFLAFIIVLGGLPIDSNIAFGAEGGQIRISRISVTKYVKDFNNRSEAYYSVLIYGDNLEGVGIGVRPKTGAQQIEPAKQNPIIKNEFIAPASDDYESRIYITHNGYLKASIDVDLPAIDKIDPASGIVDTSTEDTNQGITMEVSGDTTDVISKLYQGSNSILLTLKDGKYKVESASIKEKSGSWNVSFTKKVKDEKLDGGLSGTGNTKIEVEGQYTDIFSLRKKLGVSDDITMFPNQGPKETEVTLKADELLSNISVFFLKTKDEEFTTKNMARNETITYTPKGGGETKDIVKFKVPSTLEKLGSYYVVLTNRVDPKSNIKSQINSYKIIEMPQFILVDGKSGVKIDSITPNQGSIKGIDAELKGMNIGRISKDIYTGVMDGEPDRSDSEKIVIKYKDGKFNGKEIDTLTRTVKVFVGGIAKFIDKPDLEKDVFDYFKIRVPENNDLEKPMKDVYVEIKTNIKYKDGQNYEITETDTLKDGFTYLPIDHVPQITSIIPDKIPVNAKGEVTDNFVISIIGKNFLKYRYMDGNTIKFKLPRIDILDQGSSSEWFEGVKVYDSNGNEIEGTEGKELGTRITVTVKKGSKIPTGIWGNPVNLKVTNPLKINTEGDEGSNALGKISFVQVKEDKTPTITSVTPDVVTIEGQKGVVIKGQKFFPGVKVYIDGEEIKNAKRNELGTEISFDAPAKPEGFVQIIVQNEEGGAAVYYPFTYVKTYTKPRFIDFNPKKGTTNTLVTIKGENLVLPNPLVKDLSGNGIDKLIGTKVFLGGKDVNEYNKDSQTGRIELTNYEAVGQPIVKSKGGNIELSDYYHSIILQEGIAELTYYTIYFDTKTGEVKLTDGDKETYIIRGKGSEIIGFKDGQEYPLKVEKNHILINNKTLNFKTPYAVTGGKITGNKVKVINNNELQFIVPPMPREGYYDVTIVNPDTTRDSKTGNNGFYYSFQPEYNPTIISIEPNEGSVDGGYYIYINGDKDKKFVDNGGDDKVNVIIGGVKVDPKDVEVSLDGANIKVKVPKYSGDLSSETDMDRKTVPVVVVNPDGGSGKKEDGFTYIIPISHPTIKNIIDKEGAAAGDITVYVEGSEFRFYEPYKDLNNDLMYNNNEPFTDLNGDGIWTDLRGKKIEDLTEADRKILPKIYFGGELADIVSYTSTMIEIKTPKGQSGAVDVYLVNNDQGISNKVKYTYKASSPKVTNISPSVGKKQGGDKVEILGEGFTESNIRIYNSINIPTVRTNMQLVQFGDNNNKDVSNKSITSTDNKNTGSFSENKTKDIEIGDLTIKYDGGKLIASITEGVGNTKVEYKNTFDYDKEEIFLPVNLLKDKDGNGYKGNELIRINLERLPGASTTSRLRIDRGFSPNAKLKNGGHINLITPNYYTVGKVPVTVINPDNGEAKKEFEYKNPDSRPQIDNILKDEEPGYDVDDGRTIVEVSYLGGNIIEIQGRDFRKPVTIEIGDIKINVPIEYDPDEAISNKLRFTMPAVDKKYINTYHTVKVTNDDGGNCDSGNIEIRFIAPEVTGLEITKVTPGFGPTSGGTVVTIEGKDFREKIDNRGELKVYITKGNKQIRVPKENIISINIDKIVLKMPAYEAGLVGIKVENPDGGMAVLPNAFTYVSNPKINSVVSPDDDRRIIEILSIEGGEEIKILGSDFMEGAKVVFVPSLRKLTDKEEATDYIIIGEDRYAIESGVDGTEIKVVNGQTITVTTPPGKLGDKGVIVINPDKSATNIYNVIYGIPEIGAPFNVRAEVVFDQFIRVNWTGVKEATQYEIYMSEDGGKFEFIDTTELTSYAVQKLKPNRKYQFLVKAMGKYGTSKPIDESKSNIVRTGREIGPIDNDGKPADKTETKVNGTTADIIIGAKDFTAKGMVIDLTRGNLAGVKDITIRIPASVVSSSLGKIQVIGKDYKMEFTPSIFKTFTIEDNKSRPNVGVVFKITTHNDNIDVKAGNTIVGGKYNLEAVVYVDKDLSKIDYINGKLNFTLDQNPLIIKNRRLTNIKTVRYDNSSKTWVEAKAPNRLGLYTVIGSRR